VSADARVSMGDIGRQQAALQGVAPLTPVTDVVDVQSPSVVYAWLPWRVVFPSLPITDVEG